MYSSAGVVDQLSPEHAFEGGAHTTEITDSGRSLVETFSIDASVGVCIIYTINTLNNTRYGEHELRNSIEQRGGVFYLPCYLLPCYTYMIP